MSTADAQHLSETPSSIIDALRRHAKLVCAIVLVCLAAGVLRHERATKAYSATATVTFDQTAETAQALLEISGSGGSGNPQVDAATNQLIADSPAVAALTVKSLHLTISPAELADQISVQVVDNAQVVAIQATNASPTFAASLANAWANNYIQFQAASELQQIDAAQSSLEAQINAMPSGVPIYSADRIHLEASLQRLDELRATATGGGQLIGSAPIPTTPTGTALKSTLIIALLIGFALAFSLVVLLESRDKRLRTVAEFEREYGLPALAAIEQARFLDTTNNLEPYQILRSALDFVAANRTLRTLLVTSAVAKEGKTTIAVNLARAYAAAGRHVVLIELDLRAPSFADHLPVTSHAGVAAVLGRGMPAREAIFEGAPGLSVLAAGERVADPTGLLTSAALETMLTQLAASGAIVIIDAPELNSIADTHTLLNLQAIDAALIVARANSTTSEEIRTAHEFLQRHGDRALGLVVCGLARSGSRGFGRSAAAQLRPMLMPGSSAPHVPAALPSPTTDPDVDARAAGGF